MGESAQFPAELLRQVWEYPFGQAITGRRSRRFALGMEIPGGPLAFKSRHPPLPLNAVEQAILLCAATGVTGWNFGMPYSGATPNTSASYQRMPLSFCRQWQYISGDRGLGGKLDQ